MLADEATCVAAVLTDPAPMRTSPIHFVELAGHLSHGPKQAAELIAAKYSALIGLGQMFSGR